MINERKKQRFIVFVSTKMVQREIYQYQQVKGKNVLTSAISCKKL